METAASAAGPIGGTERNDMSIVEPQPVEPKPKLRWYQYGLRTLLIVVTLCAIPCSWLAVKLQKARREREAAAAIGELSVAVHWSAPSGPVWLRQLIGDDLFSHVESLHVMLGLDVTDTELENLKGFSQLQTLGLGAAEVTDRGLKNLKGLSRLQNLCLDRTKVTDAGLEDLTGLSQLQRLDLRETNVTDEGVKKLQQALPNCKIER
jgi:hypothetical protein